MVLPEANFLCMQLSNPASAASVEITEHTRYVAPWSPSWPTITIEPNATVWTLSNSFPSCLLRVGEPYDGQCKRMGQNRCTGLDLISPFQQIS